MSKLSRYRDLVILVAVASLLAWFLRAGSVDGEAHVAVVTAFHGLGAQEARRDHELLALRYGLSMNYDGLRAIERQLVRLRRALDDAPHLVEAVPDRDVKRTLSELDVGLTEKARRVDDFVSGSAMLNNALRGLPKVAAMVVGPAPAPSDGAIRTELERLVGAVFRYSLTGEQQIRDEAVRLIASVGEFATEPGSERRDKLQTTLFLARSIVGGQEAVDRELREILVLDGNSRIDRAREAYIGAHSILEQRVRSSRWWLYGCCLGLLAYALFKHMHIRGLNASIEQRVIRRTAELVASREQYRSLVESTHAIPWQWDDSKRRFTYVGPQAEVLLGCPSSAWLAPGFWETRGHPDEAATVRSRWEELRAGAKDVELEFRLKRDDGAWVWVRSIVSGNRVDDRPVLLQGFMLDITARRRIEFELQQAQKLESVGRLAAGVAHEINTPIQFVSDSVHFLRDSVQDLFGLLDKQRALKQAVQTSLPAEELSAAAAEVDAAEELADVAYLVDNVPKAFERSLDGIDRVATIVRSMKAFAHPDQSEMAQVDLNQAIRSTLVIARNEYKYVADVETDLAEIPPITCHCGDINQAVLNIVVNAAHAIGDIVEGTSQRGLIRVSTRRDGDSVTIVISDTGGGIPDHIRDKIFDPFFTTKPVGKGTGQGLAIARSLVVDKHDGEILLDTEPGKGSTFTIRLPIEQHAKAAA